MHTHLYPGLKPGLTRAAALNKIVQQSWMLTRFSTRSREYWMIYRKPSILVAVLWFVSTPASSTPPLVRKLYLFLSLPVCRQSRLLTGEGGKRVRRGAESYDRKKTWPFINRPILSGYAVPSAANMAVFLLEASVRRSTHTRYSNTGNAC